MRPAPTEHVEASPARIERGRYLVQNVAGCLHCHSEALEDRLGSPVKPETLGRGGTAFSEAEGVPGVVCAQNITSDRETGLGAWTDGEIMRAIREGVSRDGHALFPMMPYTHYRNMSDDDVRAIVAYLRTLPPIKHKAPESKIKFPVNLLIKFTPKPLEGPVAAPDDAKDHRAYGKYLTEIGGCVICHTPHDDRGQLITGREFSGGWEMKSPHGSVVTPNLTSAPRTYLAIASKENFIGRFRAFAGIKADNAPKVGPGQASPMPWAFYSGMSDKDLEAIYDYLKSIPPIETDSPTAIAQGQSADGSATRR
jgi:mono/diheme cytochrome c family protein